MKNITFKISSANSAQKPHLFSRLFLSALLFIIFTFYFSNINAQWVNVGPEGISAGGSEYPSLAFNGNIPYVAYMDYVNENKTTVMKFDGANWVNVGAVGFSEGLAGSQSIAINDATPYVAFEDRHYGNRTTVMKFNDTEWVYVGTPGFSEGMISFSQKLSFLGNTPYVAFMDFHFTYIFRTTVMKYNGTDWVNIGSQGFAAGNSDRISFVINENFPYIAFADRDYEGKISVMKFDGSNWVYIGIPGFSSENVSSDLSLAFNNGNPYVAFGDAANGGKISVMKFDGTNWVYVGSPGFSVGQAYFQSLAFNENKVYVAFRDDGFGSKTSVMKFDGSNWVYVGSPGISRGITVTQNLVFNRNTPYVAFRDGGNGNKISVMKFEDIPLPVELTSFVSSVSGNNVILNWLTTSETNNSGFDIERAIITIDNGQLTIDSWTKIGNVSGKGTINEPREYSFTDKNLASGNYSYRLKQIDYNGNFEYFNLSNEVNVGALSEFELSQNYPNPFNPTTNLEFGISELGFVSLKVYNASGKEVATLVNEVKPAGYYAVNFNGANLTSGIYFYTLSAGYFTATKRMLLIK